jgi:hypothetical protein
MGRRTAKTTAAQLPKLPAEVESFLDILYVVRMRRCGFSAPVPQSLPLPSTSDPRYTGAVRLRQGKRGGR